MILKRILFVILLTSISLTSYAKKEICYICRIADLTLVTGVSFSKLSHQSGFNVNNIVSNQYDMNKTWQARVLGGVGLGRTFKNVYNQPYNLSLNVMGYYFNLGRVTGLERPFVNGNPSFDTLNYKFHAESYALFFEPHLIYACNDWQPYILGGIGITRNSVYDYNEVPTNTALSAAPVPISFQRQNLIRPAFEAGFGVQHSIYKNSTYHIQLGLSLDYRYIYLGKAELGTYPAQTTSNRLEISPLSTQTIMLALTAAYFE